MKLRKSIEACVEFALGTGAMLTRSWNDKSNPLPEYLSEEKRLPFTDEISLFLACQ